LLSKKNNLEEYFDLILKLPYLETKDQFDENYKFLEEFFSSNDPESKSFFFSLNDR